MSVTSTRVSVLMPTFQQAHFIRRAVESLLAQTMADWELVVVDDGSLDETRREVTPYLADARIHYHRLDWNQGLGAALNYALARARASLIAYLPSDDVYYADHLASLATSLDLHPEAVLAYSGVKHEFRVPGKGVLANRTSTGQIEGYPLQLVQVMHRAADARWIDQVKITTVDLDRMFWS